MYLSDIEIFGFKSFAQKTKLKFASGLSAVVGPNGCGKTNIVDAIRWVLGEKKASILRSDVMENVIFNGTKDRKPLGLAEVSITFENSKGILPTEYNEVTIARRLYRSGESEYLINKTICRLKDILDLFMDTGIGSDTYSVIELKMVDAILSGKIDDRRAMFEEAAGIKKYKSRRKDTLKKLDLMQQDLQRLNDLLLEVRKNVNSLSRQAAKTKRYNQLLSDLKDHEVKLLLFDYNSYSNEINDLTTKLTGLNSDKINYEIKLTESDTHIHELKSKIAVFENDFQITSEKEANLSKIINENKRQIAVSEQKIISLDNSKELILREIDEYKIQIEIYKKSLEQSDLILKEKSANKSDLVVEKSAKIQEVDKFKQLVNTERTKVSDSNRNLNSEKSKIENLNSTKNRNVEKIKNVERRIQQSAEESYSLQQQFETITDDIASLIDDREDLKENIVEQEKTYNLQLENKKVIDNKIESLKINLNEKRNNLSSKKASLDFLNSLVDNTESSKFLSNPNNWQTNSEKTLLGEAIGIDDEYRSAVITALGESAHSFVIDTREEAKSAIAKLRQANKGKSGFIVLEDVPEIDAPPAIEINENIFGWLSEIARVDDKLRFVLRGLTGKTALVKDIETANLLIKNSVCTTAVTLNGELVHYSGYQYAGTISQKEGLWVGKKERITKLNKEIKDLENDISEINSQISDLQNQLREINLQYLQNELKKSETELASIIKKIDQLELKKESIQNNLKMIDSQKERFINEIEEIQQENEDIIADIQQKNEQIVDLEKIFNENTQKSKSLESELSQKQQDLKETELIEVSIDTEIRSLNSEIVRLNNQVRVTEEKVRTKNIEYNNIDERKISLSSEITTLNADLVGLLSEYDDVQNKRQFLNDDIKSLKEQFDSHDYENHELRKAFDKNKEQIHQLDLHITELKTQLNNVNEKLTEQYQINGSEVVRSEEEFSPAEYKAIIADLRSKLNQLGSVNFMALEEFETQSERLDFYEKQMADLSDSEKLLKETIEEINAIAERTFKETFDKIQINFRMLFKKLFGEDGFADIALENDNMLESDIIITAKPPNKKPHSIEMLSGGEKTLTALALLFAIYLVKPSPFCILDEVDAPLDDANLDKFLNLIKEFSLDTQFLIVTHNKKSMEAADTLYGVTMQEDGVSKVVAVKLNSSAA
jgi:chromosome segregation protein